MSLLADLNAFYQELRRCGELGVWTCRAVLVRVVTFG